jgi:hypothetical protein
MITTRSNRFLSWSLLVAPLYLLACSSSDSATGSASGGTSGGLGSGGATGSGGKSGSGGSGTGGAPASGGAPGTGGASATGGASGTGGKPGTGGTTGSGGVTGSGGATSTGGKSATGGSTSMGGSTSAGGASGSSCAFPGGEVTAALYPKGLTLTKACSPYKLGDITVHEGGVLTIEAGATLEFDLNTAIMVGDNTDGSSGKLIAIGTAQSMITMTSQTMVTTDEGWYGLQFFAGTAAGSEISYATISYAGGNCDAAIVGEPGLGAASAGVTLDHVAITKSLSTGILTNDAGTSFVVKMCTLDGRPYTP